MDSVAVTVPLRPPTKKMKKRKELDALAAPHAVTRRNSGKRSSQELLTDSSDDRSEYWSVSTRGGRKCRGSRRSRVCPGILRACSAFLACASILATATLIWLFIDVRQQLSSLRTELEQVSAGTAGMPESIQKCHSQSRDLLNNQTIIFSNIEEIKLQISNFTAQLSNVQRGLHGVQETIQGAPELVNFPIRLKTLETQVASLGSQIGDLGTTVASFKESNTQLHYLQDNIIQNLTTLEHSLNDLSNITKNPQAVVSNETKAETEFIKTKLSQIVNNLTLINDTLTRNINSTTEDQLKDHKFLESLRETAENVSAKVLSLDGEYAKIVDQISLQESVNKLNEQMKRIEAADIDESEKLKSLENSYIGLTNLSEAMKISIDKMKESLADNAATGTATATTMRTTTKTILNNVVKNESENIGEVKNDIQPTERRENLNEGEEGKVGSQGLIPIENYHQSGEKEFSKTDAAASSSSSSAVYSPVEIMLDNESVISNDTT